MAWVNLEALEVRGILAQRAALTFARLAGEWYRPHEVFTADKSGWPGDWEGRSILATTLMGRATHQTPPWLEEILERVPQHLNAKGYFGKVQPKGVRDEQQMSGHSWFLRGLIEYYYWKKDPGIRAMIERIARNLLVPSLGVYPKYPLTAQERLRTRNWRLSRLQSKTKTHDKSIDTGCAFLAIDGVSQAYELLRWPKIRELLDEMIARFLEMDLVAMKVQTHATLSACRGILRLYEQDGEREHLAIAQRIFDLYKRLAWTENYGNYNWFDRPRWTEVCAIVDSFIVAVWLWRNTGDPQYLEDAHHIYYNSVEHSHRASGGFGSARCLGTEWVYLEVTTYEVEWCCNMRGGEVWPKAYEFLFWHEGDTLTLPFYHNATATIPLKGGALKVRTSTTYPYEGKVRVEVLESASRAVRTLRLFAPSWTRQAETAVLVNGRRVRTEFDRGFLVLKMPLKAGDRIELDLGLSLHVKDTHNQSRYSIKGYHTFRHGPCVLAADFREVLRLGKDADLRPLGMGRYELRGDEVFSGAVLAPISNPHVFTQPLEKRQVLFKEEPG